MTKKITKMFVARARANLTQQDLASHCGVTQPRISAWENGKSDIPPLRAEQISRLLGVPADELAQDA